MTRLTALIPRRFLSPMPTPCFSLLAEFLLGQSTSATAVPVAWPLITLAVGIVSVLGMIIGLKLNAFLALIISALIISLMIGGDPGVRVDAVVSAFGSSAGGIGIVIAMAAIIGKCMLDSGSADRIVRWAVAITGEGKASLGLMGSGFLLAIPVFFDTVFYLLVPLARSLYRQTQKNYLRYLMAIATGGAITHTLVPPTPGPLLVSANLGVDVGLMIIIGIVVAIPSAMIGLGFSFWMDHRMTIPMRPIGPGDTSEVAVAPERLPSLWVAVLPVVLPVVLIGAGTLAMTRADREDLAKIEPASITDIDAFAQQIWTAPPDSPAARIAGSRTLNSDQQAILSGQGREPGQPLTDEDQTRLVAAVDRAISDPKLYDSTAWQGVELSPLSRSLLAKDQLRMKPVDRRRMNRSLLEDAMPQWISAHQWDSPARSLANRLIVWSNPNFALLLAGIVAMATLTWVRKLSLRQLSIDVEEALMSGGVIILITAAGGAFGAMLTAAGIGPAIEQLFSQSSGGSGVGLLALAFVISAVLKIAQGSSTVAMIVASSMMGAILTSTTPNFNAVYIATAVGSGSLIGSWMNDSGFWVFAKMGGLTESETLKSWTPLLVVLGISGFLVTVILSQILPLI
jgi:GntP family gluconate:H+ symporter